MSFPSDRKRSRSPSPARSSFRSSSLTSIDDLAVSKIFAFIIGPGPLSTSPSFLSPTSPFAPAFALALTCRRFFNLFSAAHLHTLPYTSCALPFATPQKVLALENRISHPHSYPSFPFDYLVLSQATSPRHVVSLIGAAGKNLKTLALQPIYAKNWDKVMTSSLLHTSLACCPNLRDLTFRFPPRARQVHNDPIPSLLARLISSARKTLVILRLENATGAPLKEIADKAHMFCVRQLDLVHVEARCDDVWRVLDAVGKEVVRLRLSFDNGLSHGRWCRTSGESWCRDDEACMRLVTDLPSLCPKVQRMGLGHVHRLTVQRRELVRYNDFKFRTLRLPCYPALVEVQLVDHTIAVEDIDTLEADAPALKRISLVDCGFSRGGVAVPEDRLLGVWGKLGKRLVQLASVPIFALLQAEEEPAAVHVGGAQNVVEPLEVACPNIASLSFISRGYRNHSREAVGVSRMWQKRAGLMLIAACTGLQKNLTEIDLSGCVFESRCWLFSALRSCSALETVSLPIWMPSSSLSGNFRDLMSAIGPSIRILRYRQDRPVSSNYLECIQSGVDLNNRLSAEMLIKPAAAFCTSLEILDVEPRLLMRLEMQRETTDMKGEVEKQAYDAKHQRIAQKARLYRIASLLDRLQQARPKLNLDRLRAALEFEMNEL